MYSHVLRTLLLALFASVAAAQPFEHDLRPLVRDSCVRCHGVRTVTPLNLVDLDYDLTDRETFATWEKVYERLERGEMPPDTAPQPARAVVDAALTSLGSALTDANLSARGGQRTPLRWCPRTGTSRPARPPRRSCLPRGRGRRRGRGLGAAT